jgi:hypothetical protein
MRGSLTLNRPSFEVDSTQTSGEKKSRRRQALARYKSATPDRRPSREPQPAKFLGNGGLRPDTSSGEKLEADAIASLTRVPSCGGSAG